LPGQPVAGQQPRAVAHEFGDIGFYIVRRFLALLLDLVVVGVLLGVAIRAWLLSGAAGGQMTVRGFFELAVLLGTSLFVYLWLFEGIAGSTIGKLVFGLAVGHYGGGRTGLTRAFVRNLILPLDLVLIGFLLAAVTPGRRRLGDLIAGTVVANSLIGPLAPLVGLAVLAGAGFADYSYAGGVDAARNLANEATRLAPALIAPATPSPLPPTPTASSSP
jgi:uncharacterized RDD family membrane protein YckC